MRIRSHLASLVAAVVLPTVLLAAVALSHLRSVHWSAETQRLEERVDAVALAVDAQIDGSVRALQQMAALVDPRLRGAAAGIDVDRLALSLLELNPLWNVIELHGLDGAEVRRWARPGAQALAPAGTAFVDGVRAGARQVVSDLVLAPPAAPATYIGVPVLRDGAPRAVLVAGIGAMQWLQFLERYGIAAPETLTLNDSQGLIIARTLDPEQWVGKRSGASYWDRTRESRRGGFSSLSIDGQEFFSAFSRQGSAGWVTGSGGPRARADAEVGRAALLTTALLVLATLVAVLLAALISDRIAGAIGALMDTVSSIGGGGGAAAGAPPSRRIAIDEVEAVQRKAREADQAVRRQAIAHERALERATHARVDAEAAIRAKDEFIAMLSHELRNPLSAITSASALLAMTSLPADAQRHASRVLERQVRHLTTMVDDLLDITRLDIGKAQAVLKPLDLTSVVTQVVRQFEDGARCGHLDIQVDAAPAWVRGDERRLEQVVTNLLDNACKFTPAGGRVLLRVHGDAQHTTLTVADDGAGLAPELLPRLFDAFTQGRDAADRSGGLGLGLAVVKRLVELHGGTVTAGNGGPLGGAVFTVRLETVELAQPARQQALT